MKDIILKSDWKLCWARYHHCKKHRAADERFLERCHPLESYPWALANGDNQQSGYGNWQGIFGEERFSGRGDSIETSPINIDR